MTPIILKNPRIEAISSRDANSDDGRHLHRECDVADLSFGTMNLQTMVKNAAFVVDRPVRERDSAALFSRRVSCNG
jgi:hypothetical protein